MDQKSLLITGADGQVGKAMVELYPEAQALNSQELDVTDKHKLESYNWGDTQIIINAAAYTNVDGAETNEGRVSAWKVNAAGVANLAKVANDKNITLVHISTDYVFDGTKTDYKEDEPFSPLSSYGATKAAGDIAAMMSQKHYVLRSSWVIGEGKNFVRTMLELGQKNINPSVVADQIGRPTFASEFAKAVDHLLKNQTAYGTYNVTNGGPAVSWADFAREIFNQAGMTSSVTDTSTEEYFASKSGVAKRPLNSLFDISKLKATGFEPQDWRTGLSEYIKKELGK